ncbi:suppressor of swi4 1 [Anaeramoeba flamelloides]|uniref:Suppressor of swi4 1 n=1 Tax=Anaeramoeba flamelloides TaxID=1746091 RepID=A0AAV7YAE4_9EUKA|nr:suppressor of swi4 1 [Anaeramoeba flamelloides]
MGKRRKRNKKRKQRKKTYNKPPIEDETIPRTFVLNKGRIGRELKTLMHDLRKVMSPYTATNLVVRRNNTLKDFLHVSGHLGVSHFMILSSTDHANYFRALNVPNGPTFTFKLSEYSLMNDVVSIQSVQGYPRTELLHAPLLVLSGFAPKIQEVEKAIKKQKLEQEKLKKLINKSKKKQKHKNQKSNQNNENKESQRQKLNQNLETIETAKEKLERLELMASALQSMFPELNIEKMKISECKRVVLFHYDLESDTIFMRHFIIKTRALGLSQRTEDLIHKKVPDLGDLNDISDFFTKENLEKFNINGMASSTAKPNKGNQKGGKKEKEKQKKTNKKNKKKNKKEKEKEKEKEEEIGNYNIKRGGEEDLQQRAVRLVEIGPRLSLELYKIENGFLDGEVLFNKYVRKSTDQIKLINEAIVRKRKNKEKMLQMQKEIEEEKFQKEKERMEKKKQKKN